MTLPRIAALLALPVLCFQIMLADTTAQESVLAQEATPTPAEIATPAMWRVADEDTEIILLGTIHFLPPSIDWRNETLTSAFDAADIIYFEANPDDANDLAQFTNIFKTEGVNPPGVNLTSLLEAGDAAALREISQELKIDLPTVERLRPWNAFWALSFASLQRQGFDPNSGVDRALVNTAKISGKKLRYFETLSEQVRFFADFDAETERNLLVMTIRNWTKEDADRDRLLMAWTEGDTDHMDTTLNDETRAKAPVAYDVLITNRNTAWAEELDAALKEEAGKIFVAVGAAHLVGGELSVPALLAQKGYDVSPYGVEITAPTTATEAANDNEPASE